MQLVNRDNERFMGAIQAACFGRTFLVTASGKFGLGPDRTAVKDKVYVLLGSNAPVILSQLSEESYGSRLKDPVEESGIPATVNIYIGQAYVDELMVYCGDLRKDLDEGRRSFENVYLERPPPPRGAVWEPIHLL